MSKANWPCLALKNQQQKKINKLAKINYFEINMQYKQIIQKRKIWLSVSGILVGVSILALLIFGLNGGIDFTGGSLLEIRFEQNTPSVVELKASLEDLQLEGDLNVQPTEENGYIIRFQSIEEDTHQQIISSLQETYANQETGETYVQEDRYESIGPAIGQELRTKAVYAIILVLIFIVIYISYAFRKVSWPVKSWKYGLVAIVTLFHDILITLGIFAVLGQFFSVEIGLAFVAALLTILGYSVNDTIVVFDRIRENLSKLVKSDFEGVVNRSVNETVTRSVNTSVTTFLVLLAIFLFGGASIKFFVLALMCGVVLGTYSSIFVASPLLVVWERWGKDEK